MGQLLSGVLKDGELLTPSAESLAPAVTVLSPTFISCLWLETSAVPVRDTYGSVVCSGLC